MEIPFVLPVFRKSSRSLTEVLRLAGMTLAVLLPLHAQQAGVSAQKAQSGIRARNPQCCRQGTLDFWQRHHH